ncbi:MAG: hypothetical protein ACOC2H_08675 [Spirochaetota bacterium]
MNNILIENIITLFLLSLVVESCVSLFFSITAVRLAEHTMAVKTTKEAVTFITAFIVLFFLQNVRIFDGTTILLPEMADYIITSLVSVRFMLFLRNMFSKTRD